MERIVVTDLKDPKVNYFCPCSRWLDKNEDDGLISRDLVSTDDLLSIRKGAILFFKAKFQSKYMYSRSFLYYLETKYKISVFTGDKRAAGTDADVKMTLYGKFGDSGDWKLDNKENNFERGK